MLTAIVCTAVGNIRAQDKYAGAFLQIPVGAHALSMGGAFTGIANDESAFHWNPAGVSLIDHRYFGFMYSSEFGVPGSALANFFHLGFTYPLESSSIALNWVRLGVGDLSHTPDLTGINITAEREKQVFDAFNGAQDIFSDAEDALILSVARNNKFIVDWGWLYYSHPIELPIGLNFKYIHESVGKFASGQGIGVDAGIMLRFSLADYLLIPALGKLSVGVNVTDIGGTKLTWSTQHQQTIDMRILAGTGYTQELPFLNAAATFAYDFAVHENEKPRFGVDVLYAQNISLRMGVDQGDFSAGAGFLWQKKLKLDYSLSLHDLGPEHRLSFGVDLDNILNPPVDSSDLSEPQGSHDLQNAHETNGPALQSERPAKPAVQPQPSPQVKQDSVAQQLLQKSPSDSTQSQQRPPEQQAPQQQAPQQQVPIQQVPVQQVPVQQVPVQQTPVEQTPVQQQPSQQPGDQQSTEPHTQPK